MSLHTNRWHMAYFLCNFQGFSFALGGIFQNVEKVAISMLFPLQQSITLMISLRPSPVSFVHCHGFLRNLSVSLHTSRWHIAYFLCNFKGFPLLWAASAKLLKKLQFPSFQWVSWPFSSFSCALGCSTPGQLLIKLQLPCFPSAGQPHFYDFIALRGPSPVSFVHCQGFLRKLCMSLHTKKMAHGLFSLQFSRFFFCFGRLLPNC